MELTKEQKQTVLKGKIELWRQRYYSHQVDAQVAQDIGGMQPVLDQARENMAQSQKVIDALEKLMAEVGDDEPAT